MSKYFDPLNISPLSNGGAVICAVLTTGLKGDCGSVAVHASKKGMRITINGKTVSSGKNGESLHADFMTKKWAAEAAQKEAAKR